MSKRKSISLPKGTVVPNHIAIVLDGNGRWARSRGLPATAGHEKASKTLKKVIESCREMGVHTLTLWGFSTENWKRPPREVQKILSIVKRTIKKEIDNAEKEGVRFIHLGRKDRLPKDLLKWIQKAEKETKDNTRYTLNLALDYGGRDEMLRAVKKIVEDKIPSSDITEEFFSSYLDTAEQIYPNPDLFIRTSGEQRTSGLMPWQMVYSEFYFEEDHLPDMTPEKVKAAILDFSRRRRRFGGKDKIKHFQFKPEIIAGLEVKWWRLKNIPEGTKFVDYTIEHIKEQFGISKELSTKAAKYLLEAVVEGEKKKWKKAMKNALEFYKLIKDEVKLAFEPSVAATLQVKLWKELNNSKNLESAGDVEKTAKNLYAEIYRISLFQAAKLAHLRVLANFERNLAERGMGEHHWEKAEDYLQEFYSALKERVA